MEEAIVLIGLCVMVAVIFVTFVWHLLLGVPYVPTPKSVTEKMIDLANLQPNDTVYDLGAGDGRFLIAAKKRYPTIKAVGYELVPTVWIWGWLRTKLFDRSIHFRLGNAVTADVSDATVVFLYITPNLMGKMEQHLTTMLKPGTRVLSYTFPLLERTPKQTKSVVPPSGYRLGKSESVPVFLYEW